MQNMSRNPRPGVLIISVLAGLALVMLLTASWLKNISLERRQLRAQQSNLQAECLAQAGLARAAVRLAADRQYAGESFEQDVESLRGRIVGKTTIRVEAAANDPLARLVTATADLAGPQTTKRTRQRTIVLAPPAEPEGEMP